MDWGQKLLRHSIAVVLFLAFAVRAGWLYFQGDRLTADPDAYRRLAHAVWDGEGLAIEGEPTAYRPPLYPLVLVPCVALGRWETAAIGFLHFGLGVATVAGTIWLGRRICPRAESPLAAPLGGLLVALDPILLAQSSEVMTETLATALAVFGLAGLAILDERPSRLGALVTGLVLGLAALCRPVFLVWLVLVAALQIWNVARKGVRPILAILVVSGGLIPHSPWAVRNWLVFGRPILTTTHGGYTLLLGNNPSFYRWLETPFGPAWDAEELARDLNRRLAALPDEKARDELARREAMATIRGAPATFAKACLYREWRLWGPLPEPTAGESPRRRWQRIGVCGYYLGLYALVAMGIWRAARTPHRVRWTWSLLLAMSLCAVHALYWTNLRMRAPCVPAIALLAGLGGERLVRPRDRFQSHPRYPGHDST